jgi:hypothetical protein
MPLYRVQAAVERGNDLTIDDCVNTFYLQDIGPTSDPGQLCQDSANVWATMRFYPTGVTRITAKIYDMDVPEPRVPLATRTAVPNMGSEGSGPSEVALCLSFFATSNTPRRRGRLYIGPFFQGAMTQRPSTALRTEIGNLAGALANLGGVDVDWMQYSPTNLVANKVTDWWVDNEWDTIRSRGLKGTLRTTGVTGE